MWQASCRFVAIFIKIAWTNYIPWVPVLTSEATTCHTTNIFAKHAHSLRIPSMRICTTRRASRESVHCRTDSQENLSPISTKLTYSSLWLPVIFLSYPQKLTLNVTFYVEWLPGLYRVKLTVKKKTKHFLHI